MSKNQRHTFQISDLNDELGDSRDDLDAAFEKETKVDNLNQNSPFLLRKRRPSNIGYSMGKPKGKSLKKMALFSIQFLFLFVSISLCFPAKIPLDDDFFDVVIYPSCHPKKVYFWTDLDIVEQYNITKCPEKPVTEMQITSNNFSSTYVRQFAYFHSAIFRERIRFLHIKNAFASSNSMIAKNDGIVKFWDWHEYGRLWDKTGLGCYDHLIHIPCLWSCIYGHFISDYLVGIVLMPQEIIDKSFVLTQFWGVMSKQFLNIIGFRNSQIVNHYNEWCFAKNLYVITSGDPYLGHSVYGITQLAKVFNEKLHLDEIKADRYYVLNREKNKERWISNFNELFIEINKALPQYKWEIFKQIPRKVKRSIKQWAAIKVMVCHAGSGSFNIPFMKKGTGLCVIMPNSLEYGIAANAASLGIWVIGVSHDHALNAYDVLANIPWTITSLLRLCFALEHGKWPNNSEIPPSRRVNSSIWEPFWNASKIRKELGIYECL